MAILEYASNISNVLDLVLYAIAAAGVFYGLKVKFVGEARKAAVALEKRVSVADDRITKLYELIVNNANDIAALKERTRHL